MRKRNRAMASSRRPINRGRGGSPVGSRRVTPGGGSRHAENDQAAHEPDDSEAPPLPCLPPEIDPDSNCDEVRGHAIPQSGGVIGEKEPNDHDDHDDECAHQRISARVKGWLATRGSNGPDMAPRVVCRLRDRMAADLIAVAVGVYFWRQA